MCFIDNYCTCILMFNWKTLFFVKSKENLSGFCFCTLMWNNQHPAGLGKCSVGTVSANLRAASVLVRAAVQIAVRKAAVVSRHTDNVPKRAGTCCFGWLILLFCVCALQKLNATTFVPTRCVYQSHLCVMVWSTAKTAVMNWTAPEHVSVFVSAAVWHWPYF